MIILSNLIMLATSLLLLLVSNTSRYLTYIILAIVSTIYVSLNHLTLFKETGTRLMFNGTLAYDSVTVTVVIVAGVVALWLITSYGELHQMARRKGQLNNEWIALIVLLMISLIGLASSNSYLSMFVAVELQSLVLYILLASPINSGNIILNNSSKISISYLINAATATGFLLYGIGTNSSILVLIAVIWKLGVVPVHVWSIPILDNLHSIMTATYLTLAKYGLLVVIGLMASSSTLTGSLLVYLGLTNLIVANVLGLLQYRYQRIITYSSLIQLGYMLLALSYSSSLAITYFELYGFSTVMLLLLWTAPHYAIYNGAMVLPKVQLWILVFTLYTVVGLPWMPLFWTKLQILLQINSQSLIIALISTLLSSLIYVRLIKYISFFKN